MFSNYVQVTCTSPVAVGTFGRHTGHIEALFAADRRLFVVVGILLSRTHLRLVCPLRPVLRPFDVVMALHPEALPAEPGLPFDKFKLRNGHASGGVCLSRGHSASALAGRCAYHGRRGDGEYEVKNKNMQYILSILLLCAPLTIGAQTAVSGQTAAQMMQKVGEMAQKTKTMQCSFTQTKTLKMLSQKMVSKGRMAYSQPSKLRWQYVSPYQYTFILNGTKVLMKSAQRKDVVDAAKSKVFREITAIMMSSVTGECLTDKQRFKTQMLVDGNKWIAQLTPLKKEMKQMFSLLVITFDSKQLIATTVEMREKGGDNTIIELHQVKKNAAVSEEEFKI